MSDKYLTSPKDYCIAYKIHSERAGLRAQSEMSEYLGIMNKLDDQKRAAPEKSVQPFHFLAPLIDYEEVVEDVTLRLEEMMREEKIRELPMITSVGIMAPVGDVVGVSFLGTEEKGFTNHLKNRMKTPEFFSEYGNVYLETEDGHKKLVDFLPFADRYDAENYLLVPEYHEQSKKNYIHMCLEDDFENAVSYHQALLDNTLSTATTAKHAEFLFAADAILKSRIIVKDTAYDADYIKTVCGILSCLNY